MVYEIGMIGQESVFRVDATKVEVKGNGGLILYGGDDNIKMEVSEGTWKYYLILPQSYLDLMTDESKAYIHYLNEDNKMNIGWHQRSKVLGQENIEDDYIWIHRTEYNTVQKRHIGLWGIGICKSGKVTGRCSDIKQAEIDLPDIFGQATLEKVIGILAEKGYRENMALYG